MKRSVMVNYLIEELSDIIMGYDTRNHMENRLSYLHRQSSKLLNSIEDKGMLPPIDNEMSFKILENGEMAYSVHEWEPE